jgi:dephospho-CoA kinase
VVLRVGLTGGIASGKSTVARTLAALGCLTVDADATVARLYRPGAAGHQALIHEYGTGILLPDQQIDRARLADIAFVDHASASRLNSLIHPLVLAEEERTLEAELTRFPTRDRIYVVEATLLLEAGGRERYDRIIVVDADPQQQLERAVSRGMSRHDAGRRIEHQMAREARLALADYVIDNRGDARSGELETHRIFAQLRNDLEAKKQGTFQGWSRS